MPSGAVQNRSFQQIFNPVLRFEIPFFQRGYAWERKQWEQLFTDLQEQVIDELNSGSALSDVEHFFGPVVVLERIGGTIDLKEFLVVDGQQRITTIYLLLALISREIEAKKHASGEANAYVKKLRKFLVNEVSSEDDYDALKLFSSKGDRLPTYRVVFGDSANPNTPFLQTDVQLYVPGKNRVDEFASYAKKRLQVDYTSVPALWQLAEALLTCLKIVWIPLDESKDDPQAIFESLNDKGMPLKASELICNYLFRPLKPEPQTFEKLHNTQWLGAIRILGGDNVFEDYLRNLFSIDEPKMVGKHRKVYVHFKSKNRTLNANTAKTILSDIHSGAKIYYAIKEPNQSGMFGDEIANLLICIKSTRMDSSTPFVLSVLRALKGGSLQEAQASAILRQTLTLLVRRKATELSTTQYDMMFPQLFGKISHEPDRVSAIQEQFKKHQVWVSNQEFEAALVQKPTYRTRDLAYSRMLLIEIDKSFHAFGQLPDYTTIPSIEHTLPQVLDDNWRSYLGKDAADDRLHTVRHTIGNLCLLSGPANSSAGQNPFRAKVDAYPSLTKLAEQLKDHQGLWNIDAILARSRVLAARALEVWSW